VKMTYLRQSNRIDPDKKRARRIAVFFVVTSLLVSFVFPHAVGKVLYSVFSPVWKAETNIAAWFLEKIQFVESKASLIRENEMMKKELALHEVTALELTQIRDENSALKELLGRPEKGKALLAAVLRRPPISPYDTLVIDAGSDYGIALGDAVFAQGSLALGTIKEIFSDNAVIELFSSPNRETEVLVGVKGVPAKAVGLGGGNFKIELPVEVSAAIGDSVRMPGINATVIGIVGDVRIDKSGSVASLLVKAPYNMNDLSFVEVISSSDEKKNTR
jgi:cell shape-determining protein MreC